MSYLRDLYRPSLGLLTDFYQLTMAYGYWKAGVADRDAIFHLYFRKNPFDGGYTLAAGLDPAIDLVTGLGFDETDLAYLEGLRTEKDDPLFESGFLDYLGAMKPSCDVEAIPEGRVVFAPEPLLRITGPIAQCQLLETPLLNTVNYQTLIATKAARIRQACGNDPLIEFGLRRAQGVDGSLSATRAAYIGGADATSNVLGGRLFDIPVRGTHAHSWVMFFDSEREAFLQFARTMPDNCIFLVDTFDTLEGVRNAIEIGLGLQSQGHRLMGIRLDSGDLAYLSVEARRMLDKAGLNETSILASNDLDEHLITSLKQQDSAVGAWGVGTRLVTGFDQPSLGGIYKLSAVRDEEGQWSHRLKLSEQTLKVSYPGRLQVRRFTRDEKPIGDMIYETEMGPEQPPMIVDPKDPIRSKAIPPMADAEELLIPVVQQGQRVYEAPSLATTRRRALVELGAFHPTIRRLDNPHEYPVGLDPKLNRRRTELILEARGKLRGDSVP